MMGVGSGGDKTAIMVGYPGLAKELREFFRQAPQHYKAVIDKTQSQLDKARQRGTKQCQEQQQQPILHNSTGKGSVVSLSQPQNAPAPSSVSLSPKDFTKRSLKEELEVAND